MHRLKNKKLLTVICLTVLIFTLGYTLLWLTRTKTLIVERVISFPAAPLLENEIGGNLSHVFPVVNEFEPGTLYFFNPKNNQLLEIDGNTYSHRERDLASLISKGQVTSAVFTNKSQLRVSLMTDNESYIVDLNLNELKVVSEQGLQSAVYIQFFNDQDAVGYGTKGENYLLINGNTLQEIERPSVLSDCKFVSFENLYCRDSSFIRSSADGPTMIGYVRAQLNGSSIFKVGQTEDCYLLSSKYWHLPYNWCADHVGEINEKEVVFANNAFSLRKAAQLLVSVKTNYVPSDFFQLPGRATELGGKLVFVINRDDAYDVYVIKYE